MNDNNAPLLPMPIKVKPYAHQVIAFNFVCKRLGLLPDSTYSPTGYTGFLSEYIAPERRWSTYGKQPNYKD